MALTVDKLMNDDRFTGDNVLQFLAYMPLGLVLLVLRCMLALLLWVTAILLPDKWALSQLRSTLACWTFGVYVKLKGSKDPRCSVMVANYVSCLDSLAASHVLGTISPVSLLVIFMLFYEPAYLFLEPHVTKVWTPSRNNFLRKWKVPPFFASTLGIRNASQFARKQHFADCPSKPVLLQPEGGPTNGKGLLKFTDWPFQLGNRVQPVAITASRPFTAVTVHSPLDSRARFPWSDALWFLWTPATRLTVRALPPLERGPDDDDAFAARIRASVAAALGVEMSEYRWEQLNAGRGARGPARDVARLAAQVKEVLPRVPLRDIMRDLAVTRSVDVTITNFLEGAVRYSPEPGPEPGPARYVIPVPTGVFPKTAKERQLSFQEKKAQMIAEARKRYIEKHNLDVPAC